MMMLKPGNLPIIRVQGYNPGLRGINRTVKTRIISGSSFNVFYFYVGDFFTLWKSFSIKYNNGKINGYEWILFLCFVCII